MVNIDKISTENLNNKTTNIDEVSTPQQVLMLFNEFNTIDKALREKTNELAALVDCAYECVNNKGRIYYVGAGTSGRLGILDASEILPTYGEDDIFKGVIAGGKKAVEFPVENAEDDRDQAIADIKGLKLSENDMVIGISASGRTPYVASALQYAKSINLKTGSISNSNNSEISTIADFPVEVVVGPEPIVGSTRMKSGSAQKITLNVISTLVMVKMGKTYGNLMIDVVATNQKLLTRSIKIIQEVTGVSAEIAKKNLDQANGSVKLAIVMIHNNETVTVAKETLAEKNGRLKDIIG